MLYLRPTFAAAIAIAVIASLQVTAVIASLQVTAVIASLQVTAVTFYNLADSPNLNQNNSYEYYTIRLRDLIVIIRYGEEKNSFLSQPRF